MTQQAPTHANGSGQYLTFLSGDELYAVDIMQVNEIIEIAALTRVPKTPAFIRGVINLRGGVVPVVDLTAKLGNGLSDVTSRSCVVLVGIEQAGQEQIIGLLVDEVREIIDIDAADIKPPPAFGDEADTGFIQAMAQVEQLFIILLDVSEVLTRHEILQASVIAEQLSEQVQEQTTL
ncbi:MAG: purine-binding chemotaxis protein CheW [Oceanospirillales bacterium]|uniref:Purine-binding chemotaxis protein CheW n=1 Tax=Marinobacterium halophilum TaxID=267374 RepID=A0A2P8F234_9GAMM|nr:chemotaxis protein CheW [Marinobacterium halophilum]MBR9827629.1 purine-binding chemotaxis protein CheW [Oceanospirillales bacterium]PSL15771.1 purine-binding chemotaxis protein CheW [Marinobacterium halophilum]